MKIVSVHVYMRPNAVDFTDQEYLVTLRNTRLVVNLDFYPSPRLTITCCCPTCLIPTEIKFGVLCEKIDFVNLVLPYVFKCLDQIVTVLYFLC